MLMPLIEFCEEHVYGYIYYLVDLNSFGLRLFMLLELLGESDVQYCGTVQAALVQSVLLILQRCLTVSE